jgi:AcrR family transcriptional regulator
MQVFRRCDVDGQRGKPSPLTRFATVTIMAAINRRTKVLRAALDLIAESGVRGLRLEDVAARADVALSLIYYHFGNRIDLLRAVFDYANEQASSTAIFAESSGSGLERLESGMLGELRGGGARRNAIVWNELIASSVFEPELRPQVTETTRSWIRGIEETIRSGQSDGSIRADVDATDEAEILANLLDGLATRWIAGSISAGRARALLLQAIRQHLARGGTRCLD